jgi:3-hydroxyisobutyrate dehydrogenase-like beta-hydroxyacid dehydrogenase
MSTVAVVGLGAMGSRIARRLLDAGYTLVVWNRTAARAEKIAGAEVAASPADAARRSDAVITMVADPPALQAVTEGSEGIAAASTRRRP